MDARILQKILHDFETMTVEEYRDLHAHAIERSKSIEESILIEDYQSITQGSVDLNPINVSIDTGKSTPYETIARSVYITYSGMTDTKLEGEYSWVKVA